jgi:hypothetical protein
VLNGSWVLVPSTDPSVEVSMQILQIKQELSASLADFDSAKADISCKRIFIVNVFSIARPSRIRNDPRFLDPFYPFLLLEIE